MVLEHDLKHQLYKNYVKANNDSLTKIGLFTSAVHGSLVNKARAIVPLGSLRSMIRMQEA